MRLPRKIPYLRWWIIALLFCSTVINYIDRQTLSILASTIQRDLHINDLQYAKIVQAFLLAYTAMFLFAGRLTDRLGTRLSMALYIAWWSLANMMTALARSAFSLGVCRFLLGVGEPGNYTAAPKAVSEWFPPKERGLAVGIYTAGAMVGATIAPPLIVFLNGSYGWRACFLVTGALGFVWLIPWLWLYRVPHRHPRITEEEYALITAEADAPAVTEPPVSEWQQWKLLLRRSETWYLLLCRLFTDPVWYFYLFWFPKYLTDARKVPLEVVGGQVWVVYLAADIGSIVGGWASGVLIKRGLVPVHSRKIAMTAAACLLPLTPLVAFAPSVPLALLIASITVFAHLVWQVSLGALILDLYPKASIATVMGIIAAGSGLGGFLSQPIVGKLVTNYSYTPVFLLMGILHPYALLFLWRVRQKREGSVRA